MNKPNSWDDYIFIFDTSSLINMYLYSSESKDDIINLLERLKNDLWLPNKVNEEFEKHRKSKLYAPIDLYKNLIITNPKTNQSGYLPKIKDSIDKIQNLVKKIKSETIKKDKHPFIEQDKIDFFLTYVDEFNNKFDELKKDIEKEVNETIEDIKSESTIENDSIYTMINNLFQKNIPYTFSELLSIYQEGKVRYEYEIPPGFMDSKGKNKKVGTAMFGDLIIWKEILDIGKKTGKSILLISNDTKEDWCSRRDNRFINFPRTELVNEYKEFVGKDFWMCTLSQFIYDLNDKFNSVINEKTLEEVVRKNVFSLESLKDLLNEWMLKEFNELGETVDEYKLFLSNGKYEMIDIYTEIRDKKIGFEIRGMKVPINYIKKRCIKIKKMLINSGLIEDFYFIISYDLSKEETLKLLELEESYDSISFLIYNLEDVKLEKI